MARTLVALLALATVAGCGTPSTPPPPPTDVSLSDSGVLTGSARVSIGLGHGKEAPSQARPGHAIELAASMASGEDTQGLSAGQQPIRFGNQGFVAPQDVRFEFDYRHLEVAYRYRRFDGDVGFEALGGIANTSLDLTASGPAQRASDSLTSTGASGSFGLLWRPWRGGLLQARATLFLSPDDDGITQATRFEFGLLQAIGSNFGLRAGYLYWDLEAERSDGNLSPIRVKFSGPVLGLELMF